MPRVGVEGKGAVDGATRDAIAAAVRRQAGVLVVAGDPAQRAVAIDAAREGAADVVEVRPADGTGEPWAGLATLLDSCRVHAPHVAPPAALEAASAGRAIGDHLGLAADLRHHLMRLAEDRTWTLLVHDAHRFDLSSAAVLGHALGDGPDGVRAVVTQDRSARGVRGLSVHVVGDGAIDDQVSTSVSEPGEVAAAERRAREAADVGAVLDAAAAAEAWGDWVAAASWWLEGAQPQRCARALEAAGPVPEAAAVAVRLALRTASDRRRREVGDRALALLDGHDPVGAARVRILDASVRVAQGDAAGAAAVLDRAAATLAADAGPAARVARELHDVIRGTLSLLAGGDAKALLRSVERPLARLGAGRIDGDAVQVLTTAAMPLAWHGHLDEAGVLLDQVVGVLDARRHFVLLAHPLATSAWLSRRRSRLELALTHGSRAIDVSQACGWTSDERRATVEVAHVEAIQGRLDDCRRHVASLVPPGAVPQGAAQLGAVSALAVAELFADEPARVVELLEPVQERFADSIPPAHTAWRHNLVEAYVRTDRIADAERVLCDLARWADRTDSDRERGLVSWCRGMVAPASAYDALFAAAGDQLAAYPALRWRAGLSHLRRLLADARSEAGPLADELVASARAAGLAAAAEHVRDLQRHHGADVESTPTMASLSVDDLRVVLALAEGADPEDVAVQLRITSRRVEAVRARVLGVLGIDDAEHLAGFLRLERSAPPRSAALVRILGPTVVQRGAQQLVPPAGRPAALLALVATEGGAAPVERVLDVLWPDTGVDQARSRLRNVLARLRAAVGGVVERDGERLVLASGIEVDARRFDRLADDALRAGTPDELLTRSERALAAWGGDPLPAWPYDDWALRERQRLVQRCVTLHVRRADVLAAVGEVGAALDELEQAVALQPDGRDLWERAVGLADADERVGRARSLRRRAADHDIDLI